MAQREYKVEDALVTAIEFIGGACAKHVNTGYRGDPDRICSFPWRYHCMVETKWATGETPEAHQLRRHKFWRERGLDVWVACDRHDIDRIIAFAVRAKILSAISLAFPLGPSTWDVGSRPRIGED